MFLLGFVKASKPCLSFQHLLSGRRISFFTLTEDTVVISSDNFRLLKCTKNNTHRSDREDSPTYTAGLDLPLFSLKQDLHLSP